MSDVLRDLRLGLRLLRRQPAFTGVALATIALGIGATTAIFSVVHATFLAPLPYREPERLAMVYTRLDGQRMLTDAGEFDRWRRQATAFEELHAWTIRSVNLAADDRPEHVEAGLATPGFLAMMGLGHPLARGRDFAAAEGEPGADESVILTHALWRTRFGADPGVVGRSIRIDGRPRTVVGVLAPGAADRMEVRLWLPLAFTPAQLHPEVPDLRHSVVGRLREGTSVAQAHADMVSLTARLRAAEARPRRWAAAASVEPFRNSGLDGNTKTALWLLLAAVSLVLLIACANVANLLLARGTTRRREMAVRAALGARPRALVRQLLAESLVLALLGGALGIALASLLLRLVLAAMPAHTLPAEAEVRLSLPVLLFTLGASVACALLFGAAPARRAAAMGVGEVLKDTARTVGRGRDHFRRALVTGEIALAMTLLAAGGLAVQGLSNLARVDLGFVKEGLLTFTLPVPPRRLDDPVRIDAAYRDLLFRLQAVPGVVSASVSTTMPLQGPGFAVMKFDVAGRPPADPAHQEAARLNAVSPDYFSTFGIPVIRGRSFDARDGAGARPVAIVNEAFAARYLAPGDAVGQRLAMTRLAPGLRLGAVEVWEVVGVCGDARNGDARSDPDPEIHVPFAQNPWPDTLVALRTRVEPRSVLAGVAAAVRALDPDLPLAHVRTMEEVVAESVAGERFHTLLFAAFGAAALLLATAGVYGLMSFVVAQRTREIGIRMALGAPRARVLRDVLGDGMASALVGAALGCGGAYAAARLMRGMVYGAGSVETPAFAFAAFVLLAAALFACLVPARRAASVDPVTALRRE